MTSRKKVLQSEIDCIGLATSATQIIELANRGSGSVVCLANVHMTVTASEDAILADVMARAELVLPDGMPLVKIIRRTHPNQERVAGYDLILEILRRCQDEAVQVSFVGSTEQTLEGIARTLRQDFPGLVAPIFKPLPFFKVGEPIGQEHIDVISSCGRGVVFVGLGCPKQEIWMDRMRPYSQSCMIGVGAAFHLLAGEFKRAPSWARASSIEWLFRLCQEPKKLARRYFETNIKFITKLLHQRISSL